MTPEPISLPGLPAPLTWDLPPASASVEGGTLTIVAGPQCDLFNNPAADTVQTDSPRLLMQTQGDFALAAHVEVGFQSTFDAGVLLLWVDDNHYAKLCFEYSPQGESMIVSVVTNGRSDDCNSVVVEGNRAWLRVSRLGNALALHWSADGQRWAMVRYFTLNRLEGLRTGFSSQSPTGQGCRARFNAITWRDTGVADIRSGE